MNKPTKIEIIDEVIAHINKQGRAIDEEICRYLTPDGKYCADSYLLKPEYRDKVCGNAVDVFEVFGDIAYQEKYQGHCLVFHSNLQFLHDNTTFWKEDGKTLSPTGELEVTRLKKKWANG